MRFCIGENLVVNSASEEHGKLNHGSCGTIKIQAGEVKEQKFKQSIMVELLVLKMEKLFDAWKFFCLSRHMTGSDGNFKISFLFSAREGGKGGADVAANNRTEVFWGGEK